MKKSFLKFCLLACITLFSVACSNSKKLTGNEFHIEGIISGVEDRAVITLFRNYGGFGMSIANDTIKNGRFTFTLEAVSNPEKLSISCSDEGYPSYYSLDIWVAPGKRIKITGKDKLFLAWKVKSSIPYQKEENRYTNKSRDIIVEQARIAVKYNELSAKLRAAVSEDEAIAYIKSADSLNMIELSLRVKQSYNDINIMEKADISTIWLDKLNGIAMLLNELDDEQAVYLRKKAEELYGRMSEEDRTTSTGYKITDNLFPTIIVDVGDDFVDADLLDVNGNTKRLADYLGKYLLLDFWSIGCGPCIMALPEMKEISETYHDKLTIVSINLDTDAAWKKTMNIYDVPWVNVRDPQSMRGLAANYGVYGIPNYVMISPEGKIADIWMGYETGYLKEKVGENIK